MVCFFPCVEATAAEGRGNFGAGLAADHSGAFAAVVVVGAVDVFFAAFVCFGYVLVMRMRWMEWDVLTPAHTGSTGLGKGLGGFVRAEVERCVAGVVEEGG